jgi:hypothetical protein
VEIVLYASALVSGLSALGLLVVAARAGLGLHNGQWALWLPSVFGASIVTGTTALLSLLLEAVAE